MWQSGLEEGQLLRTLTVDVTCLGLMVVSLFEVKMSVLAETLACVHFINKIQEYTNEGLGRYMI